MVVIGLYDQPLLNYVIWGSKDWMALRLVLALVVVAVSVSSFFLELVETVMKSHQDDLLLLLLLGGRYGEPVTGFAICKKSKILKVYDLFKEFGDF